MTDDQDVLVLARTGVRSDGCCVGPVWRLKGVQGGPTAVFKCIIGAPGECQKEYFELVGSVRSALEFVHIINERMPAVAYQAAVGKTHLAACNMYSIEM